MAVKQADTEQARQPDQQQGNHRGRVSAAERASRMTRPVSRISPGRNGASRVATRRRCSRRLR